MSTRSVKTWIRSDNVKVMEWPLYSQDLNTIENVWGWLAGKVYEGGKQYVTQEKSITGKKFGWSTITLDYLEKIYDSLPRRMCEVLENKGEATNY